MTDCAKHLMEQRWGNVFFAQNAEIKNFGILPSEDYMSVVASSLVNVI